MLSESGPQLCMHPGKATKVHDFPPSIDSSIPSPLLDPLLGVTSPGTSVTTTQRSSVPTASTAVTSSETVTPRRLDGVIVRHVSPPSEVISNVSPVATQASDPSAEPIDWAGEYRPGTALTPPRGVRADCPGPRGW